MKYWSLLKYQSVGLETYMNIGSVVLWVDLGDVCFAKRRYCLSAYQSYLYYLEFGNVDGLSV